VEALDREMGELAGWQRRGDRLLQRFSFDDFRAATKFVGRIADAAVAVDDEVEIEVRANQVTLTVLTPGAAPSPAPALPWRAASTA
jgi:pterin-4a-carbinolamine dehydratase